MAKTPCEQRRATLKKTVAKRRSALQRRETAQQDRINKVATQASRMLERKHSIAKRLASADARATRATNYANKVEHMYAALEEKLKQKYAQLKKVDKKLLDIVSVQPKLEKLEKRASRPCREPSEYNKFVKKHKGMKLADIAKKWHEKKRKGSRRGSRKGSRRASVSSTGSTGRRPSTRLSAKPKRPNTRLSSKTAKKPMYK